MPEGVTGLGLYDDDLFSVLLNDLWHSPDSKINAIF